MSKCFAGQVIAIAKGEVGYLEKATNAQLEDKTANAGHKNWNKYAAWIDKTYPDFYNGRKNGYDWCDIFVDYCFLQAYGLEDALRLLCQPLHSAGAGCTASYNYYKMAGRICQTPCVGAQIFYTKDHKSCYHTGIVVGVRDGIVTTIEGNTGDKVAYKTISQASGYIMGYGIPDYDKEDEIVKTDLETVAAEVLAGKWGNGQQRRLALAAAGYDADEVQKKVNELIRAEQTSGSSPGGVFAVTVPKGTKTIELTLPT